MSPHTRPRARFSCGPANSVRTLLQSHSSSSATSIASAVRTPCPISDLAILMVTSSFGAMTIHAVISGAAPVPARAGAPNGISKPSAREPLAAATLRRKQRRLTAPSVMLESTTPSVELALLGRETYRRINSANPITVASGQVFHCSSGYKASGSTRLVNAAPAANQLLASEQSQRERGGPATAALTRTGPH